MTKPVAQKTSCPKDKLPKRSVEIENYLVNFLMYFFADPRQMQALIYLIIGITIAFILTSTLIFSVCHCIKASSQNNQDSKLVSNQQELVATIDESESRNSTFQRSRNSNFQRQSYLQQSPMTEETISLEEFDQQHRR